MTDERDLNLNGLIEGLASDIASVSRNKKFGRITRTNTKYLAVLLENSRSSKTAMKKRLENILVVLQQLSQVSEISSERRAFYGKQIADLRTRLGQLTGDPEIEKIRESLESSGIEQKRSMSEVLLSRARYWRGDFQPLILPAHKNLSSEDLQVRRNIAGFFYFLSSNNPGVISTFDLDLSVLAEDNDPTIRGISMLIAIKIQDEKIVDKAFPLLNDNSMADLRLLNLPEQLFHFPHNGPNARVCDIARETVQSSEKEGVNGSRIIMRSFVFSLPDNLTLGNRSELLIVATPVVSMKRTTIDLTGMGDTFSLKDQEKIILDDLKIGERREIKTVIVPTVEGILKSKIIVTSGRFGYEFTIGTHVVRNLGSKSYLDFEQRKETVSDVVSGEGSGNDSSPVSDQGNGASPVPSQSLGFPSSLLDTYSSPSFVGAGGFARVYRAVRLRDGKPVALKIPKIDDKGTGEGFIREVNAWFELRHKNIVELYKSNVFPIPYIEMEYLDRGLDRVPVPLSPADLAKIGRDILEGLDFAHSKSRIHTDLKPSNILLSHNGEAKIGDWGLSRVQSVGVSGTTTHVAFTPAYAAPEQFSPKEFGNPDLRTDIYQVGAILFYLASGFPPFEATDILQLSNDILRSPPRGVSQGDSNLGLFGPVILKALSKRKNDRFQTASEFLRELDRIPVLAPGVIPGASVTPSKTQLKSALCASKLQLVENHLESRDRAKVSSALSGLKSCISKDEKLTAQVEEIISHLEAYAIISTTVDDAMYSQIRGVIESARSIVFSA